jgi:hypothetical protein
MDKETEGFGAATIAIDRDNHARRAYLVEGNSVTVVIVRPDGFIGAIVNTIEGIERYFKKIFRISV